MSLNLFEIPPYDLDKTAKDIHFREAVADLTRHHGVRCPQYGKILSDFNFVPGVDKPLADYPFLPARLFKLFDLKSVDDADIRKVLTSSGTSGQRPSKIYLDADTSSAQIKVLSKIMADFIGQGRRPMLVIDAPSTVKNRNQHSARAAGIVGFSMFGRDVTYALKDDMSLDMEAIEAFCLRHPQEPLFLFGFTFMVYQHFILALKALDKRLDLDQGILVHGGGWKKLADLAVDNHTLKQHLLDVAGIGKVHNYYGMVEQTGSILMECEEGHFHCSNFSDIIVRAPDFSPLPQGQKGMVELFSLLPKSYPGHVILTEDEGTIWGEDACPCGRSGKYFSIHGRLPLAEVRGCSDTYAAR